MDEPAHSDDVVIFTTHERSAYYTPVFGFSADMRYGPVQDPDLEDLLHNILVAHGGLVVIDEAFFTDPEDMVRGLEQFVLNEQDPQRLKIIIVAQRRKPGDSFLAFLVMFCGLFNIIFDKSGVDVSKELQRLVEQDKTRSEVSALMQCYCWDRFKQLNELLDTEYRIIQNVLTRPLGSFGFEKFARQFFINVDEGRYLRVALEIEPVII